MGSLGPPHLIVLLLAVAIIAAACGFTASTVLRQNKRSARRFFLLGVFCGFMAGMTPRGSRRGRNTGGLAARALTVAASGITRASWPLQWQRQMGHRLARVARQR
jgi:hypothetical protein